MSVLGKIWNGFKVRDYCFWLNADRAVRGAVQGGVDANGQPLVDETISGASQGTAFGRLLDRVLPGGPHGKHTENAAYDDKAQQAALDKAESGQ